MRSLKFRSAFFFLSALSSFSLPAFAGGDPDSRVMEGIVRQYRRDQPVINQHREFRNRTAVTPHVKSEVATVKSVGVTSGNLSSSRMSTISDLPKAHPGHPGNLPRHYDRYYTPKRK